MLEKLRKAFRVSAPLVSVDTLDPGMLQDVIGTVFPKQTKLANGEVVDTAIVAWDIVRGLSAPPQDNASWAVGALHAIKEAAEIDPNEMIRPEEVLRHAGSLPSGVVLVMHNVHRFLEVAEVSQALWNLRDQFKNNRRMIVLAGVGQSLPACIRHDVLDLVEPLPSKPEILDCIGESLKGMGIEESSYEAAAEACQGLSLFAVEQTVLLNVQKSQLDVPGIWRDKCAKINSIPGLEVVQGGKFNSIAGLDQIKFFVTQLMKGKKRPRLVVQVDEIEKAIAGSKTDTSGVTQDQLAQLLYWMESNEANGCILAGAPGTSKSAFAQAAGTEFDVPTIRLDLGAMKGGLVGESEARIREALRMLQAISGGQTLWMATCNSLDRIPPELRRRFRFGTWYMDLPTLEERTAIWSLYCDQYALDTMDATDLFDLEWTGAEIRTCCDLASQTGMSLVDCQQFITPVSGDPAGAADLESLRKLANGSFLDAARPGVYKIPGAKPRRSTRSSAGTRRTGQV